MQFEQIIMYSMITLDGAKLFLFFIMIYRSQIQTIFFPTKKVFKDSEKKFNELYQRNKQKKLMKHKGIFCKKHKDLPSYKENPKIVKIANPVGKWTKNYYIKLSGELMQRLALLISKEGYKKGFWELFVKAKASTTQDSKYKVKSR